MSQQFNFYFASLCPFCRYYIDTIRSDWEEYKKFIAEQLRSIYLKKYNHILTLGRWYTKDTKDAHILYLFGVAQNLMDDSKKTS